MLDRDHRRPTRPEGPGADGPDPDARQDPPAGRSPGLLVLHRASTPSSWQMMLANIDHLTAQIHRADARIDELCRALPAADRPARRHARHRDHHRPGCHRRNRRRHDRLPAAAHLVSWARQAPQVTESAGKRKGKQRHREGESLSRRRPRRSRRQRLPHPAFLGGNTGDWASACRRRKPRAPSAEASWSSATNCCLTPQAEYKDLGTDYYERRANIRREVRSHARAIERRGYRVILEPIDPGLDPDILPVTKAR